MDEKKHHGQRKISWIRRNIMDEKKYHRQEEISWTIGSSSGGINVTGYLFLGT
jgi:hypothetical protein